MKLFNHIVLVIGVGVLSTPMSTLVHAQQSANTVLLMQSLQAEIGDLRDMIERQDYRIRQLQREVNELKSVTPKATVTEPVPIVGGVPNLQNSPYNSAYNSDQKSIISTTNELDVTAEQGTVQRTVDSTFVEPAIGADQQINQELNQLPSQIPSQQQGLISIPATESAQAVAELEVESVAGSKAEPTSVTSGNDQTLYPPVEDRIINQGVVNQATGVGSAGVGLGTVAVTGAAVATSQLPESQSVEDLGQQLDQASQYATSTNDAAISQDAVSSVQTQTSDVTSGAVGSIIPLPSSGETDGISNTVDGVDLVDQSISNVADNQASNKTQVESLEETHYQEGFDLLKQSKHDEAVLKFKQQINEYPNGDLSDDAHYWIAESMYVNRRLNLSKEYFKAIIDNFQSSSRLPDAMLKTAYIEQEQGNKIEARILLQEIIQFHPSSNAAISAKNRLSQL